MFLLLNNQIPPAFLKIIRRQIPSYKLLLESVSALRGLNNNMEIYFSECFEIDQECLNEYGAFDISLVTDLPLFIDPFLLFNSQKEEYQNLHKGIITYLRFLRDKVRNGQTFPTLVKDWCKFPEVKQTWLGFTKTGNDGRGLGNKFAEALQNSLDNIFRDFGDEKLTQSSHLEKLCLIREGVGRDCISDFTTNLIKGFLCEFTQKFAREYVSNEKRKIRSVSHIKFNYATEIWESSEYDLPYVNDDYVLLTPRELLTKDDTWINKTDLVNEFERLPESLPNAQLRFQVNNYLSKQLNLKDDREPTRQERNLAIVSTVRQFPVLVDVYIRDKEDRGEEAENSSNAKVKFSEQFYVEQIKLLRLKLEEAGFYKFYKGTYEEARQIISFFKDVIEKKGGHKIFYNNGKLKELKESDIHIMYRLCWYGTSSDVSREANDGRGPVDFKISKGSNDKTIVEFKLAKNTRLKQNLSNQTEIYQEASDAKNAIKVIVYFSEPELERVEKILQELNLLNSQNVILIDARMDNKPSASNA